MIAHVMELWVAILLSIDEWKSRCKLPPRNMIIVGHEASFQPDQNAEAESLVCLNHWGRRKPSTSRKKRVRGNQKRHEVHQRAAGFGDRLWDGHGKAV